MLLYGLKLTNNQYQYQINNILYISNLQKHKMWKIVEEVWK